MKAFKKQFQRRHIIVAAIHFVLMSLWAVAIGVFALGYGFSDNQSAKDAIEIAFVIWNILDFPMGLSILLASLGDSWALLGWVLQVFVSLGWSWLLVDVLWPHIQRIRPKPVSE